MRRRAKESYDDTPGGDSFLDIVANIVGILVLLVVVVGVRAARSVEAPEVVEAVDSAAVLKEAKSKLAEAASERLNLIRYKAQVEATREELDMNEVARITLAELSQQLRADLDAEREKLSQRDAEALDQNNRLAQKHLELERLAQQQLAYLDLDPVETETIALDTTPIVRERVKDQVYLRLKEGRVAYLPIEELKEEFRARFHGFIAELSKSLDAQTRIERVVGPVDGFSLRCVIVREIVKTPQGVGAYTGLLAARLEESESAYSEPIEAALSGGSTLSQRLSVIDPDKTVVTIAVYPDSFAQAHSFEQGLRGQGYRVAKTLEHQDSQITFSPHGRETVLQ